MWRPLAFEAKGRSTSSLTGSVHVGAQRDDLARQGALEQPDHAGAADAGLHLSRAPAGAPPARRCDLLVGELRVGVDVAAPVDHARLDGGHAGLDVGQAGGIDGLGGVAGASSAAAEREGAGVSFIGCLRGVGPVAVASGLLWGW
jgi:hypothetical protein